MTATTDRADKKPRDMHKWVTAEALLTLGAIELDRAGQQFTAQDLADWTRLALTPTQRVHATSRLCALGFVQYELKMMMDPKSGQMLRTDLYTLTAEGSAAVKAAVAGHVRKSGPKGERKSNPVDPHALSSRVWSLIRMRRVVDSDSLAATLSNAGDDKLAYARTRASVQRYLQRWTEVGALEKSVKRMRTGGQALTSNGVVRYVLIMDSATPPKWHAATEARASAREASTAGAAA